MYLIYWGPEWAKGFTTPDTNGQLYSSKTLQNYLNTFMANLGGSPWASVQTQYCRNVPAGTTNCGRMIAAKAKLLATRTLIAVTTEASRIAFIVVIDSSPK